MDEFLTITEVAQRTGLSAHTLRYYERAGLIAPVDRAPGGQRRYAAADLEWISFLMRLRGTRMPVGQMQMFAQLRSQGESTVAARRALLEQHLVEVQESIRAMQHAAQVLQTKVDHYRGQERTLHDRGHR
ncbi:MerR family transcriptional regulator [uncultured Aquabacterium sp.]|jgi:DNA-binding transcriptional MerR regulator|uniref:MerR family transcriptional regulator n=1 Tax=uncultured Aquabacterium sp. TaxID=158753 RepID=UPI00260B8FF5|nr:MerR family transcriptional regulator [uncultured Aquabacterium sp.]